jgi:tripartite ATP-independent transporter DctP family solute receptor
MFKDNRFRHNLTNPVYIILAIVLLTGVIGLFYFYRITKSPSGTPEVSGENKVFNLTLGHNMPTDGGLHIAAEKFAELVQAKTKGRVRIQIYPNQTLANDQQMIEMAIDGQLDILIAPTAKISMLVPEFQYLDIPFLFPKIEDAYAMMDGEPGRILLGKLDEFGLTGAAFWGNGFKQFTANKAIHSPRDFKGMNIRVMNNRLIMDQFSALGANPIPIDFHETYAALKDGVVEGHENPVAAIYGMKFYKVQSHIIISNHAYLAYAFCFGKKKFESLPPDIRQALMSTARELTDFERKQTDLKEVEYLKSIKDSRVNIIYLSDKEIKEFQKATRKITYKYSDIVGKDIMDITQAYLKQKYHTAGDEDIILGLNADLSLGASLAGISIKRGMEIAVNEINEQGGVLGKKLTIIEMDHAGISARSIDNIKHFGKIKNLAAIFGGFHSSVVLSDLETIHQHKIIYLIPWAMANGIVHNGYNPNFVFRLSATDTTMCPFLITQALKKSDKIALLIMNNEAGRQSEKVMTTFLKSIKINPTAVEWFNLGDVDMTAQLDNIREKHSGVIVLVANSPEGISIIKNMARLSMKTPIISHWAITGGSLKDVRDELKNFDLSFIQTFSFLNPGNRKADNLIKKYSTAYNIKTPEEIFDPVGTAQAYDLVYLLVEAIRDAGTIDSQAVQRALEKIKDYDGVVKTLSPPFTSTRHDALDESCYMMAVYNKNGAIIPVNLQSR